MPSPVVHAVIGDVVASREASDRVRLHRRLQEALGAVEDLVPAQQPPAVTVGDEFQGVYADLGDAVLATLVVRLHLLPDLDVRCGIGTGQVQIVDPDRHPPLQDGSAWWAAREAIEEAERRSRVPATRSCRSWYAVAEGATDPLAVGAVRSVLVLRDDLVARVGDRARRVLLGGLSDLTQTMVAEQEGITQSAVSQLVARDGLAGVQEAHALLRR